MQQLRFFFAMALLYMFRVTIPPIIRSTMLYMACNKRIINKKIVRQVGHLISYKFSVPFRTCTVKIHEIKRL